jgi:hypothetical protein
MSIITIISTIISIIADRAVEVVLNRRVFRGRTTVAEGKLFQDCPVRVVV